MKLYLISQSVNSDYDTYSDAVVCADDEEDARRMHPDGNMKSDIEKPWYAYDEENYRSDDWAEKLSDVKVEYLGEAKESLEKGVVCASYHAG